MASSFFKPATRKKVRLRMAIDGPSGSGKTFTMLRFAFALGKRIAVINSESGAIEKYLGLAPDGIPWQFDICTLVNFAPTSYTEAILAAGKEGYDVVLVDSLSHAWAGAGGALEIKDNKGGNSFTAWKDVTPMHNRMIEGILHSPCHVLATMRSKTEFIMEADERGRQVPRKIGLAPVQRAGMEYEFDIYASLDNDHTMRVTKTRCPDIDGAVIVKPSANFMAPVIDWLNTGSEVSPEFYAVTDADLEKHAKKEAEANPAPKPQRKSAEELMREAAGKQTEETAVATVTPPANTSATGRPGAVAQPEIDKLISLFARAGVDFFKQKEILAKRNAAAICDLTTEQGAVLIAGLEKKLAEAEAAMLPVANVAPDPEKSKVPPETTVTRATGPCLQPQIDEIKSLLKELEQIKPDSMDAFAKRLRESGKQRISDLTQGDADRVISGLRQRTLEWFFTASLENWEPKPAVAPAATVAAASAAEVPFETSSSKN